VKERAIDLPKHFCLTERAFLVLLKFWTEVLTDQLLRKSLEELPHVPIPIFMYVRETGAFRSQRSWR
jgi:hypothetical protein